ncbi:MAG: ATP-grasp domain-containing protein [Chloroflexi bacterium]|nr:ATP-grasp domain-containing protein [Chloroflexota bacterium]
MARTFAAQRRRGALVIGGDYVGLGVVRSLGRRGIPVWVLDDEVPISLASRYTRKKLPWPRDERAQVDYLLSVCSRYDLDAWLLYPTRDETAAVIARHHDVLAERYTLTTAPWASLQYAYDKRLTYQLAAQLGIPHPKTLHGIDPGDRRQLDLDFPVILKPAIKHLFYNQTRDKAWRVDSRAELVARYRAASAIIDPAQILIQELVPGRGHTQYSFGGLCWEGEVLASVVARRLRQHPMDFGHASTFVETVEAPQVEAAARRWLAALRYSGVVEIEFKYDARTDEYKLLDVNPRFWGWHTLAARAGVDFPYLQWRLATQQPVKPRCARPGVRWVRMVTDLPTAAGEIVQGKLRVGTYLHSLAPPVQFSVLACDDPAPALFELLLLPYLFKQRGF